ncbi:hypothetical protein ACFOWM_02325 [Ferruginibacter yonginensis]|uniref:Uncharacterized protein n=1 Tax=Ferruginibacter yonginensis TaxID=1310416 RepID=A0ABV8QN30_9BACT
MNTSQKILLVQLFSNGDCLYATTIARQIKIDYPNCDLTWAIADFCKNIINNNEYVDNVVVVKDVKKNDINAFRQYKKKVLLEKKNGKWDEVFITTNIDTNLALYDGTIRGMILNAYPQKINVPIQPILKNTSSELDNVQNFVLKHSIDTFKNVILWEYAPQSGQVDLNFTLVKNIAEKLVMIPSTCIILSSANKFESTSQIIDASELSVRENAALTHYCTLLIGCSSGITWLTTSTGAKFLPMVQLLNPDTIFINIPSVDFNRYNVQHNGLIELFKFDENLIFECVSGILKNGFENQLNFNQQWNIQFKTTSVIVYNLLVYGSFKAIVKHFMVMKLKYGLHPKFIKNFLQGLLLSPFRFAHNFYKKRLQ